jgi:hypothetical protein
VPGVATLIDLSRSELRDRVRAKRIPLLLNYAPRMAYIVEHQIEQLRCISLREIKEERDRLIDEWWWRTRDAIEAAEGEALWHAAEDAARDMGVPDALIAQFAREWTARELARLVGERQAGFERDDLPGQLDQAVMALLQLELTPEECASLQRARLLALVSEDDVAYDMIRMRRGARVTYYYRDHPDTSRADNLLALPRYIPG